MINSLIKFLFEAIKGLLPLIAVLLFFQLLVLRSAIPNLKSVLIGFTLAVIGLFILIRGLELGLFPMGESLGILFAKKGSVVWTLLFALCLGYATTIAEPSLIAVALKAEEISQGIISEWRLRNAVAIGVSLGVAFGIMRIILNIPLSWSLMTGYMIVIVLTRFAPPNMIGLAYDCGGVTTGPITVPFVTALGIGISSSISGRDPYIDGFGLIAFASLFPIIAVLILGIAAKHY
jgi:hypothetical protein